MVNPTAVEPAQVWQWLEEVPDPEVPAVSVVDLGIVREVRWEQGEWVVTVTPTYSGCPATAVIARDIAAKLRAHGVAARLETRLAPPWTTDWLSAKGREALRAFGIAPPAGAGGLVTLAPPAACPHCGARDTECVSAFGSTPCKALYRCLVCREPFDYFKPH
jgi:ring-1,2-phenylacetyl-CoA epoxidase subunit PaaD